MDNKLNFGNLIAHFIPGLLTFFIFLNSNLQSKYIIPGNFFIWFKKNEIFSGTIIIAVALALGLCIDSFRYLIICLLLNIKNFKESFNAIFIRAPVIQSLHNNIQILSEFQNKPVMVQENNLLATTFHPELTDDTRVHEYFIDMVKKFLIT